MLECVERSHKAYIDSQILDSTQEDTISSEAPLDKGSHHNN